MATPRRGKAFIWVTHLAKLLGGHKCVWSAWFKSHYRYDKYELMAADLEVWNREHTALMQQRTRELERGGWRVAVEDENAFKLEGAAAIVAGKPDLIATRPGHVLVIDGKTGRERESDIWQVLLYLFAIPRARKDLTGELEGELQYKRGDNRITVTPAELTPERIDQVITLIKTIGNRTAPPKMPSFEECRFCNIGPKDCPARIREHRPVAVGEF